MGASVVVILDVNGAACHAAGIISASVPPPWLSLGQSHCIPVTQFWDTGRHPSTHARTHAPRHDALGLRWPINVPGDPIQSWLGVSSFMHRFGTLQYTTTTPTDRCISVTRYVIEGPEADSDLMLDGWTGTVRYDTADRCVVVISRSDFVIANQPSSSHRGFFGASELMSRERDPPSVPRKYHHRYHRITDSDSDNLPFAALAPDVSTTNRAPGELIKCK
jgi:hypothetical protein